MRDDPYERFDLSQCGLKAVVGLAEGIFGPGGRPLKPKARPVDAGLVCA